MCFDARSVIDGTVVKARKKERYTIRVPSTLLAVPLVVVVAVLMCSSTTLQSARLAISLGARHTLDMFVPDLS